MPVEAISGAPLGVRAAAAARDSQVPKSTETSRTMARRRTISVHDYPEHLNPFSELDDADPPVDEKTKYHTTGRRKSRSHLGSSWSLFASLKSKPLEASLNLSPRLPRSASSPNNEVRRKLFPDMSWLPGRRRFGGSGLAAAQQDSSQRHRSSSVSRTEDNSSPQYLSDSRDENNSTPRYRSISVVSRPEDNYFPRYRSHSTMSRAEDYSGSRYRSPSPVSRAETSSATRYQSSSATRNTEDVVFQRCRSPPGARTQYSERLYIDEPATGKRSTWSSPSIRVPRSPSPSDSQLYAEPLLIVEPGDSPNPFGTPERVMHRPPRPGARPKKRRAPPPPTQPAAVPAPTPAFAEGDVSRDVVPVTTEATSYETAEQQLPTTPDKQPTTPERRVSPDAMHTNHPATPPPTPNESFQELTTLLYIMAQEVDTELDTMSQEVDAALDTMSQDIATTPDAMSDEVADTPPMTPNSLSQEVLTSTDDETSQENPTTPEDTPQPIPRKPSAKTRTKFGQHLECR